MNEQTGAARTAETVDAGGAALRWQRMQALQRAHRARQALDREAELAARYGRVSDADDDADTTYRHDVERLQEIHRNLQHERRVARRPFHRHSERLVLALELAERLALERLGFDDYADFETNGDTPRDGREIIDLDHLARAEQELADAEAVLAELDLGGPPAVLAPTWTIDPVLRDTTQLRATRARRLVFGERIDRPRQPRAIDWTAAADAPLPVRRPRPVPNRGAPASAAPSTATDDRVLGEIVHNGRPLRIEKIGGLLYEDDDGPGPDAITYGDPA